MKILVPSIRNLDTIPPTINFINYLNSKKVKITVYSFNSTKQSFSEGVELINQSSSAYPKGFVQRLVSKLGFHFKIYKYLFQKQDEFDYILLGAWDIKGLYLFKTIFGLKAQIIFHYHELEIKKLKYCRKSDYCLIPEINRLWISFFLGDLRRKPLLLPNIPFDLKPKNTQIPEIIHVLKKEYKIILLYQGLIDFEKRCLHELLKALAKTNPSVNLVIMPSPVSLASEIQKLKALAEVLEITNRFHFIPSMPSPFHLAVIKMADVGIGLYRPTSLNQVYAAPNRLYEFTSLGVPVILPNYPVFESLSYKYPHGIISVNPESSLEISEAINSLVNPETRKIGSLNAIKFKEDHGNYDSFAGAVLKTLSQY